MRTAQVLSLLPGFQTPFGSKMEVFLNSFTKLKPWPESVDVELAYRISSVPLSFHVRIQGKRQTRLICGLKESKNNDLPLKDQKR